jgi:hypothetical protein
VTRVVAFVPDLLFGSNVAGALGAAGMEVQLVPALPAGSVAADVLVVDLTAETAERIAAVSELRAGGALDGVRTLAFYSHVEAGVRGAAEQAGFDVVVPRSRMAREGAALVERLAGAP